MGFPKNPNNVIIKNKFYPSGLTEKNIYEYYVNPIVKNSILKQIFNREHWEILAVDPSKFVVHRKDFNLTENNYDDVIGGRTISLHGGMRESEDVVIIDIDLGKNKDFKMAKEITVLCHSILHDFNLVKGMNIYYTGKDSFHIECKLSKKYKLETLRYLFTKYIKNHKKSKKFTVEFNRPKNSDLPNVDMSRFVHRAGFILKDSLSIIGLKVISVQLNALSSFRKEEARIV